jgi:hypothetical protein
VAEGNSAASRCHSSSAISNRLFTAGFYRITCTDPNATSDPGNTP